MRRLDEIDSFMRDFGKFYRAPSVDVHGQMRQRLMMMLARPRVPEKDVQIARQLVVELVCVADIMRKAGLFNAVVPVDKAAGYLRAISLPNYSLEILR